MYIKKKSILIKHLEPLGEVHVEKLIPIWSWHGPG